MRCSSFNRDLDAYVDGTLSPARAACVEAHVAGCGDCAALLAEVRVIDALLIDPRTLDPAPNFTFKIMADVRDLPQPHRHHHIPFAAIGAYIVFAWIAIGGFLFFGGQTARAALSTLGTALGAGVRGTASLVTAVGAVFGTHTLRVTAAMGALLGMDLALAAIVIGIFAFMRARRVALQRAAQSW